MNKELSELIEESNKREEKITEKAMSNLELITEEKTIEEIRKAIKSWNLGTYGNEETEFIHSNLYQDTTDKNRIVFEKPGLSMGLFRMIYIYKDGRIEEQKESYQKHKYTTGGKWEVILSSISVS